MLRNHNPFLQDTSEIHWKHQKFEYDVNDKCIYFGRSLVHDASLSAGELWWVEKYTWVGDNCTVIEGPFPMNWDDRAAYGWV